MAVNGRFARFAVGVVGGVMLVGVGGAAFAQYPDPEGDSGVDVNVEIAPPEPSGALTLSVAGTETNLTESGSTAEFRQFTGTLPEVTVSDTRTVVPEGVAWYVTGQASDFAGDAGQDAITADHLGWTPRLVDGDGENVAPGDQVDTVMDTGADAVGLTGDEFLAWSLDSASAQVENGSWTADAGLVLKTPANVAPGSYKSTLTLSLFEDPYL